MMEPPLNEEGGQSKREQRRLKRGQHSGRQQNCQLWERRTMEWAADDRAGKDTTTNHQWEQSSKSKQWLAMTIVRGQQLAMVAKWGGGWRRDCYCQSGVIVASEEAKAS
jgi:hypothetical protein